MFGLAINLLGIRKAIGRAFAWATQSAAHIFAIGMVFALVWGWLGHHKADKLAKVLASTEQAYRNAQADAKREQERLNLAISARYRAEAEKSSATHRIALDGAHRAVSDYANRMRCKADQGGGSGPGAPAVPDSPGMAAGAGEASNLVAIALADLDTLAAGTVRAESCRAWGQSMIDAGLAEAGD